MLAAMVRLTQKTGFGLRRKCAMRSAFIISFQLIWNAPAFQFIRDAGVIRRSAGIAQAANASALATAESRTFFYPSAVNADCYFWYPKFKPTSLSHMTCAVKSILHNSPYDCNDAMYCTASILELNIAKGGTLLARVWRIFASEISRKKCTSYRSTLLHKLKKQAAAHVTCRVSDTNS